MNEQYAKKDLDALAAFAEDWNWANVPGVYAPGALHCERANAMVCLNDYAKFGGTDRLFKGCQWLWGVNPPSEVEVYGNAPFKYRLRPVIKNTPATLVLAEGHTVEMVFDLSAPAREVKFDLELGWWTTDHGNWSTVITHEEAMRMINEVRLTRARERFLDTLRDEMTFREQGHEVD